VTWPPILALRLLALGLLAAIVEIAAVSQVTLFGVSADISPLVVMSAGLLGGAILGASFGFGMGLFLDMALVQTLGVSSLVLLAIGYGAGRVRELRDPQAALTPLAAGAAATAIGTVSYSTIQFLLGVDAPVSFELLRQMAATVIVNTLIAMPVFAAVRRWL